MSDQPKRGRGRPRKDQTTAPPRGDNPVEPSAEPVPRIQPFVVEFGDNYCRNHSLGCFRIRPIRGAWSITRLHQRPTGGRDIGQTMSSMPDIPGMRLRVEPQNMVAVLFDPLDDDADLLERVNAVARRAKSFYKGVPFKPVPENRLQLNDDLLVTLLYELHRKMDAEQIEVVSGRLPTKEEIDTLPGREYYDVWNNGRRPRYVDEVPGWLERLEQNA